MTDKREEILAAARAMAQAHGYNGLNFRDLADAVGIKGASIYYHFPSKADLGAAVARRYWQDSKARLEALSADAAEPAIALARYPGLFRTALENGNRMCLCGFMAAEHDDLPEAVRVEVKAFADVQLDWLAKVLAGIDPDAAPTAVARRARAIYAAIGGAQLLARSRADVSVFDDVVAGYRASGLLPA